MDDMTIKGELCRDLSAVVLAHQTAYDRSWMFSKGMSCDIVRDAEKDERV